MKWKALRQYGLECSFRREILMCTVYHPPGASHTVLEQICEMFEVAAQRVCKEMVIMSDFNCNVLNTDLHSTHNGGSWHLQPEAV